MIMEALQNLLVPYSDIIIQIAITVTALQFLSGISLLLGIRKQGDTLNIPSGPFLGGIILSSLSLKYGMLLHDDGMIKINLFGLTLNLIYMCYYYFYTPDDYKIKVWREMSITGLMLLLSLAYTEYEDPELVEFRVGMLITVILICLVGMPFLSLGEILRTKSTKGLPFTLILSGFTVSFTWLLYGLSCKNDVLVVQNFILTAMSFIQLLLFFIYPANNSIEVAKEQNSKRKKE